jgi:hypothetical protein
MHLTSALPRLEPCMLNHPQGEGVTVGMSAASTRVVPGGPLNMPASCFKCVRWVVYRWGRDNCVVITILARLTVEIDHKSSGWLSTVALAQGVLG